MIDLFDVFRTVIWVSLTVFPVAIVFVSGERFVLLVVLLYIVKLSESLVWSIFGVAFVVIFPGSVDKPWEFVL